MKLTSSAVLLVLLALAGCGGSDSGFTDDYNQAVKPLSELEQGKGTQPREFDQLAERTRDTRENLSKLDPPDGAKDEFRALLVELDNVTKDLRAVASAARDKDVVAQREAAQALVKSSTDVQQAESELKQAVEG
jgi:prophage DNA circulation protein